MTLTLLPIRVLLLGSSGTHGQCHQWEKQTGRQEVEARGQPRLCEEASQNTQEINKLNNSIALDNFDFIHLSNTEHLIQVHVHTRTRPCYKQIDKVWK